ncbi:MULTISPECIES: nuclear transport factor 2 family protein [unclassified Mesorhizobium]|uniref:nuclear transport factor 2 family protein n=1 Tax=unclassified Mesorhizobium TaxID=325217 RepID=UPI000FDA125E|nr:MULTISPECIES: nuclear transport factor 2 family protein [unclassified Mesorhizobium]RWL44675.1 MAG: nuclear transport factor 2 family protein [Mesorhizobium sp.]TGQ09973.1 nuclear transport factor 2 family protein [Mesorhizobium sp. M2E.F.Ca.ET.219.01.1.1]TGS13225.1 nuclear transport factor 2 family protein [Mesorhizobium sp. M2E.F.Ca.ET.209.01.1.1]TGT66432.1 nuclear transport factor 2 family protein [Mesorhizobium sp. M2E.F.Ca.ET.166.01.1.1]TGV98187.1 nuclear transport factor 2 family prot
MTVTLPPPLADYFVASNRHDIGAMLAPFTLDAIVKDEGETHRGTEAIRLWMQSTTDKYHAKVEVKEASVTANAWRIAGIVSGDFPGSPITLHYNFTLGGDRIAKLEIGL